MLRALGTGIAAIACVVSLYGAYSRFDGVFHQAVPVETQPSYAYSRIMALSARRLDLAQSQLAYKGKVATFIDFSRGIYHYADAKPADPNEARRNIDTVIRAITTVPRVNPNIVLKLEELGDDIKLKITQATFDVTKPSDYFEDEQDLLKILAHKLESMAEYAKLEAEAEARDEASATKFRNFVAVEAFAGLTYISGMLAIIGVRRIIKRP